MKVAFFVVYFFGAAAIEERCRGLSVSPTWRFLKCFSYSLAYVICLVGIYFVLVPAALARDKDQWVLSILALVFVAVVGAAMAAAGKRSN